MAQFADQSYKKELNIMKISSVYIQNFKKLYRCKIDFILLEGIRLSEVSEGVYFLNAAPLNLSGADGSPCRAVLIDIER